MKGKMAETDASTTAGALLSAAAVAAGAGKSRRTELQERVVRPLWKAWKALYLAFAAFESGPVTCSCAGNSISECLGCAVAAVVEAIALHIIS
jgi:hypothetical protein